MLRTALTFLSNNNIEKLLNEINNCFNCVLSLGSEEVSELDDGELCEILPN